MIGLRFIHGCGLSAGCTFKVKQEENATVYFVIFHSNGDFCWIFGMLLRILEFLFLKKDIEYIFAANVHVSWTNEWLYKWNNFKLDVNG